MGLSLCIREAGKTLPAAVRNCARRWISCVTMPARNAFRVTAGAAGPDRRGQRAGTSRTRALRQDQPVEFSAGDLHGSGGRRIRRRQHRYREAGGADPTDRGTAGEAAARRRNSARRAAILPGEGARRRAMLLSDRRVAGVAFTGSTEMARVIARALAARTARSRADRGNRRAERDAGRFLGAAGAGGARCGLGVRQRGAALLGFARAGPAGGVAEDRTDAHGLHGRAAHRRPGLLSTDVGPVIDADAGRSGSPYRGEWRQQAPRSVGASFREIASRAASSRRGNRIDGFSRLKKENFGPVLHVLRFAAHEFDQVIDDINATGFGLTLGVQTRIEGRGGASGSGAGRQRVRKPQPDWCGGRHAALRGRRAVGHRSEGRWSALSATLCE